MLPMLRLRTAVQSGSDTCINNFEINREPSSSTPVIVLAAPQGQAAAIEGPVKSPP